MNDLRLELNGVSISGWTDISVSRYLEHCPSVFEIALTEFFPGDPAKVEIAAGTPCRVFLGDDLVVTGYADVFAPSIDPVRHEVRIAGRGKTSDLIDCSAEWPSGQMRGLNALQIARNLVKPYGQPTPITVTATADPGPTIPIFMVSVTDTPWQIIEEITRYAGLVPYEDENGNLILGQAGTFTHASGFVQGQNVQAASVRYSMAERFSEVEAFRVSVYTLGPGFSEGNLLDRETDPGVPRHRRKSIIAEAVAGGADMAKKRALWEIARRKGRSAALTVQVDSWRDAAGKLWQPNWLAPISLPALKLDGVTWCISEVVYHRDGQRGTYADLVLMDPKAFLPEPILLLPALPGYNP